MKSVPHTLWSVALAGLLCLSLAAPAWSTTVQVVGLPELAQRASLIVEGQVTQQRTVRLEQRPWLATEYQIQVEQTYKGQAAATLTVRVPGGSLEGRQLTIEGMPTFKAGERVLLLTEAVPGGQLPLGLWQGVFRLQPDGQAFTRSQHSGGVYTHAWCTGGEDSTRFDANELRAWLRGLKQEGGEP